MSRRCFRWYDNRDNRPGRGESASILTMIDSAIATEGIDSDRVFILGLSAGGAMSAVLLANYPSRFAGVAIIAGLPFDCNRPAGIFDGTWNWLHYNPFIPDGADASLTEQWTTVQGIDTIADERQTVGSAVREVYRDEAGNARLETWSIKDFAHAVPVDADGNPDVCGQEAEFIVNANLCAVRRIAKFWQLQ